MNNSRGFSLLEVLIAASILSVVILGVMKVNENLASVEQGFIQSQDSMEVLSNTKLFMGHQLSCLGAFRQAKQKRPDGQFYIPIDGEFESIKNFENNDFISVGETYGKVKLLYLSYSPRKGYFEEEAFTNKRGIVDVYIQMQGIGKVKRPKFKKLPVWVYASKKINEPAEIQYCDSSRADMINYITESVMARVCLSLNAVLDPETRLCIFGSEYEKEKAIKKAERVQKTAMKREISSPQKPAKIDDDTFLMYLMKSMLEETEEKRAISNRP